jgi:hypothetical protein
VAIKNGQSIETDNCITTITYCLSFRVTIFAYQAQLINTEILNDKIKRNNKKNWTHIYVFSCRRNQYTNTNAVFILTVTIPHWRFMIFNIDMICPIIQPQTLFISSFYFKFVFAVYEINIELLIVFSVFSNIYSSRS